MNLSHIQVTVEFWHKVEQELVPTYKVSAQKCDHTRLKFSQHEATIAEADQNACQVDHAVNDEEC